MQQGNIPGKKKGASEKTAKPGSKRNQEKAAGTNVTDTAPDEFIAPNADTDLPLEGEGIVNDAVLRGEDHQDDIIRNKPEEEKQ
jgi:hypothetical protein